MIDNKNIPYASLNPNLILTAIEALGFSCSGSLLSLNSYENRVYQVGIDDKAPLIAKFYRPGRWSNEAIFEEHQFAFQLNEQDIPVIAPLLINGESLHTHENFRFALFPRKGGRALELENKEQLEWIGRFIGRLHMTATTKTFAHRLSLSVQHHGYDAYQFLLDNHFVPVEIYEQYQLVVTTLLKKITQIFTTFNDLPIIRLHGDCHASNVLWNDEGPHIVDLDDCINGPAIQDLWMLLPGTTTAEFERHLDYLLKGYGTFCHFNRRDIELIEPLRTLRLIHYSAWLAKRWEDPAFPIHFPWFNTERYWREQLQLLREQNELF